MSLFIEILLCCSKSVIEEYGHKFAGKTEALDSIRSQQEAGIIHEFGNGFYAFNRFIM